ncbi:hypothetical protein EV175_000407 [Coemansia sp. RSA 1933]|nr:hypothetical protein EV175_000407 [Coemansia sp. RSA 1933]
MTATDSSTPPDPTALLRLSACTTLTQLAAALDELTLDPAAVLAAVPESLESRGLVALMFSYASEHQQLSEDAEWANACVARAEAVDRWTGRIDWAVQWLEAVKEQTSSHGPPLDEALRRAMLLQSVVVGGDSSTASAATLAALNAMSPDDLIAWAMARVGEWPDLIDFVVGALQLETSDPESVLGSAWNRWWASNMVGSPQGLFGSLVARYPCLFDTHIVLSAIYVVGGPCSDIAAAAAALGVLVPSSTIDATPGSDTVTFPESIWRKVHNESFESLTAEEIVLVLGTAFAQVDAGETLERLGLEVDIPTIAACQQGVNDQQRLLVRLILSALRLSATRPEGIPLWSELIRLHRSGLFASIPLETIKKEYLQRLLGGEQFEQAQALIDAQPPFTEPHTVRDAVCQAAREMFDNAESGNMDAGLIRSALRCLDVLPKQDSDAVVRRERALIDAAHLVWTLGASGFSALFKASDRATAASGEVLPIEIRLSTDPYALLRDILARTPGGYKKQRIVREIAAKLLEVAALAKDHGSSEELQLLRRDLGVHSVSEALVAALLLEAATASADYSAAYDYARQLINARPVLAKAQGATEAYRSRQLLGSGGNDGLADSTQTVQIEVRAIECIWKACVELAAEWGNSGQWSSSSASQAYVVHERRLEVASLALGLCPTSEIPRILRLWNQIQADHLSHTPDSNWIGSSPLGSSDSDPVSIVHETLINQAAAAMAQPVKADELSVSTELVDIESVRTFDAAIIKRCLRLALCSAGDTADTQRRELLLEWVDFALTTEKKPKDAGDAAFRRRMEADVAKRYPQDAIGVLMVRVLPQIDQIDYPRLEPFYAFYAQCLKSADDMDAEQQAQVRLALVRRIQQGSLKAIRNTRFGDLIAPFTCNSEHKCRAMLPEGLWPDCVAELVEIAPELAMLRPLSSIDGPGKDSEETWWVEGGGMLSSKLCLWALSDIAANSAESTAVDERFSSMLSDCLPHMSAAEDASALTKLLAFGNQSLDAETRYHGVAMCCEHLSNMDHPLLRAAEDALAYMEYVVGLRAIHDPFMFASLSEPWAMRLDVCAYQRTRQWSDGASIVEACVGVVGQMAAHEGPYFVCECYVRIKALAAKLGGAVPELSQLYMQVVQDAIDQHRHSGTDAGALSMRLKAVVDPPMELCGFEFGDGSALGAEMKRFGAVFGKTLVELAHSDGLDSAARLALLEAVDHGGNSSSSAVQEQQETPSDFLHFCLVADKHWGVTIDPETRSSIEGRCAAWRELLKKTDADKEQLVDVLVALLGKWTGADEIDRCVAALIEWAARNQAPSRVVRAMADHEPLFTQSAGEYTFGSLLEDASQDPSMVPALATLGLAYPSDTWAEQCMGLVVHVMSSVSEQSADGDTVAPAEEEEDGDAWDIDDDELLLEEPGDEKQPRAAEYAHASAMVLDSTALHIEIATRGYVSACAGNPRLVEALGRTLLQAAKGGILSSDDQALMDMLVARAMSREGTALAPGMQSAHELLRRAIHSAHEAGLRGQALDWCYVFVGMPVLYRLAAPLASVARWIAHVDQLVLCAGSERQAVIVEKTLSEMTLPDDAVDDDGWGDDIDIDLDADLENL